MTRVAILSDIHGNLPALEAVRDDAKELGVEGFVCLGDVAADGPFPLECLEHLAALDCPMVMGNTDTDLITPERARDAAAVERPQLLDIERWGSDRLEAQHRTFIAGFSATHRLEIGGLSPLVCHGSPRSYHDPIVATTPLEELDTWFEQPLPDLLAAGHTHQPFLRTYHTSLLLNPGAVGLPYLAPRPGDGEPYNPPRAYYAIVDVSAEAATVTLRQVPFDVNRLLEAARERRFPHFEWWSEGWLRGLQSS